MKEKSYLKSFQSLRKDSEDSKYIHTARVIVPEKHERGVPNNDEHDGGHYVRGQILRHTF